MIQVKTFLKTVLVTALSSSLIACNQPVYDTKPSTPQSEKIQEIAVITPEVIDQYENVYGLTPERSIREQLSAIDPNNLWHHFRGKLILTEQNFGLYDEMLNKLLKRPEYFTAISERAALYLHYIVAMVEERHMPLEIALLPAIESGFRAQAESHMSAVGLWQFIPSTGKHFGLKRSELKEDRSDPIKSTGAALRYLIKLNQRYQGDWLKALAAYNCGPGNLAKAERRYRKANNVSKKQLLSYWQIQPYLPKETQEYVPKLLAFARIVEFSEVFDIHLYPIVNEAILDVVKIDRAVSLYKISDRLDISKAAMRRLNPAFIKSVTPNGTNFLVLPKGKKQQFAELYRQNPNQFSADWQIHRVQKGDYLGKIAKLYNTNVRSIMRLNNKKNTHLRIGEKLIVSIQSGTVIPGKDLNPIQRFNLKNAMQYQVESGDSLWSIAQKHNVSTAQLVAWNGLQKNKPLQIGQILKLKSDRKVVTPQPEVNRKFIYKVQKGDNLYNIARAFGVSSVQIVKWNKLSSKDFLRPNQELMIFQGQGVSEHKQYRVKKGDSLWKIANAHNLKTTYLAEYNQITTRQPLRPGQMIKIPLL